METTNQFVITMGMANVKKIATAVSSFIYETDRVKFIHKFNDFYSHEYPTYRNAVHSEAIKEFLDTEMDYILHTFMSTQNQKVLDYSLGRAVGEIDRVSCGGSPIEAKEDIIKRRKEELNND